MHKKIMIILGVMVLLLYGYSYTEVGFSVSSIKESNLLNSIEETNQLLLSDSYKGLYVVIYQDQRNITIYEFAQNPLTNSI